MAAARTLTGAIIGAFLAVAPASASDPAGTWLTQGGEAQIRLANCGGALCGTILALREPNDPETGKPKTDKRNENASQRARPLIGVQVLLGLRPSATPDKWEGSVYNADDGKTYTGFVTLTSPTSLRLQGCVLGGLICKAQTWSRVN